jgi:hypothetical protein
MVTIVWNPRGFHLIKVLERDCKFNDGYYIAEILELLSQWRSIKAVCGERKLLVHADNARPPTAKLSTQYFNQNRMKSAPHSPSSLDLAPSDFYLFGYVKRCLAGLSFEDADQLDRNYTLNPFGEHTLQLLKVTLFQMVVIASMISSDVDNSCSLSFSLRKPNNQKSHGLMSGE